MFETTYALLKESDCSESSYQETSPWQRFPPWQRFALQCLKYRNMLTFPRFSLLSMHWMTYIQEYGKESSGVLYRFNNPLGTDQWKSPRFAICKLFKWSSNIVQDSKSRLKKCVVSDAFVKKNIYWISPLYWAIFARRHEYQELFNTEWAQGFHERI